MHTPEANIRRRNESNRRARAFLLDLLGGGPQLYQMVHEQAVAQGISKSFLMTAKRTLNVHSTVVNHRHVWQLAQTQQVQIPPD
jgi:hypothetical protein